MSFVVPISILDEDLLDEATKENIRVLEELRVEDDGEFTITSSHQQRMENVIADFFDERKVHKGTREKLKLYRGMHARYLKHGMRSLSASYQGLDASQPWLCYWIVNSLDLLGLLPGPEEVLVEEPDPFRVSSEAKVTHEQLSGVVALLSACASPTGGYGGGPYQLPHLAPTYAAVNALCAIGTPEALASVDRDAIHRFLTSLKDESGGFRMHDDGEVDIRASYCAVATAQLLQISDESLTQDLDKYIARCQTYEGGMGGEPGNEAHGGYTFCGVAAAALIGAMDVIDVPRLLAWVTSKQMGFEGGFQGRTNKLVDSCYSFWQGAVLPILRDYLPKPELKEASLEPSLFALDEPLAETGLLFNQRALQDYILLCCQQKGGGLRDKPEKNADFYHTNYSLAGLSLAQWGPGGRSVQLGGRDNILEAVNPLHGVREDKLKVATAYYKNDNQAK